MDKTDQKSKANVISAKLRALRAEHALTQCDVAKALGISQQTYSKYERQDVNIDSASIIGLCELYGVTADEILGLSQPKEKQTVEELGYSGDLQSLVDKLLSEYNKNNKG